MQTKMFAIRVDAALERRFEELARKTGRTKTFYAREALNRYIEELEDHYAAASVLVRLDRGTEPVMDFEEWEAEHDAQMEGTDDRNRPAAARESRSGQRGNNPAVRA